MAFLSLGLLRDEQDSTETQLRVVEKPSAAKQDSNEAANQGKGRDTTTVESSGTIPIIAQPVNGTNGAHKNGSGEQNGSGKLKSEAPPQAEPEKTEPEKAEREKDNWSETGLQIIQSVLRQAQSKSSPASSQTRPAPGDLSLADLPSFEELQKQIAGNIPAGLSAAAPAIARESKPQSDAAPRSEVATEVKTPPTAVPQSLLPLMQETQAEIVADSAAPTTSDVPAIKPSGPMWMGRLSGKENARPVSTVATDFLVPVMEELRRKLTEQETAPPTYNSSPDKHGGTGVLAPPAAPDSTDRQPTTPARRDFFVPQTVSPRQDKHDGTPTFATFKFGQMPSKGLLYSLIGHEVAMFAIFLFITYIVPSFREQRLIVGSINTHDHVIYLPEVGGGEQGEKSPGGGQSKPQQASAAPARASKGFAYPGAQPILSNPPNPTNAFQTVLHPLKVHAEQLKRLVPLPNIVQMAETRLPSALVAPKVTMPRFQAPVKAIRVKQDNLLHREAKWNVPIKAPQLVAKADMPKLPAAEQPLPDAPKVEPKKAEEKKQEAEKPTPAPIKVSAERKAEQADKQAAPPSTAQIAKLQMHGKSAEPLLSLSPAPLPARAKVPAGEARGRFAIAPGGKLNPNSITPGKMNGAPSDSPATGQEKSQAANATSELASNTGSGAGHNPAAGGGSGKANVSSGGGSAGEGNGSGKTAGAGVGGSGTANGRGSAGNGAGRSGQGAGTGAGAGSGSGTGAFPGITIQGGEGNEGSSDSHAFAVAPQTPYQMTIVATASSGGGLADFGVFENQRVYTVYVPMQRTPQEADPTWTLQYALENESSNSGDGQLIAPSPVMREWPQIPPDLEKSYAQQIVVVSAILGTDGKLTHIAIKQTPDAQVGAPITHALTKWVFRPAQMDNKPVSVKILLGIPL
jgi:hypothetical protein